MSAPCEDFLLHESSFAKQSRDGDVKATVCGPVSGITVVYKRKCSLLNDGNEY